LARPLNRLHRLLLAAMAAGFAAVLLVPVLRTSFALDLPPLPVDRIRSSRTNQVDMQDAGPQPDR
jgi:hypothetical protein